MEVPSPMEPLELRPVEDLGTGPPQPPSPLSGCYLLIVIGEPHSEDHKEIILQRIAKGFLSWDSLVSQVDLEKELQALTAQAPEGEEARNGERLIQYATENLVTEVLIHPQVNTLVQCVRNLLSSFTRHRHLIHAGYTFAGNGSWMLQDGTFSLADFTDAFQEVEVQRVLRAYENSVTVDVHCSPDGDWTTERLSKEPFSRSCKVRVNPDDTLTAGGTPIGNFINYISPFLKPAAIEDLLEPSDVVGNIRFSHPTLYVFPGGQGDAALFGINGFNMLVDGGFGRKSCFWDFARHLDRLDAVLMTRINNGNISGVASLMRRKKQSHVYPQIGHFFCNLQDRRTPVSPDGDKDRDPLLVGLGDEGQDIVLNLRHIQLRPHCCYREGNVVEPVNLYHKVGHGKLDMYIISPTKDSREVKDFLARWNASDARLFAGSKKDSKDFHFPLQNLVSICALLVWQPANPNDTITRILFPGSTPQHKIFEGLEKLKHLEFLKHPVCSMKSITPSGSTVGISSKVGNKVRTSATVLDKLMPAEKENMREASQKAASIESNKQTKSATIPVASDIKSAKMSSLTSTPITKVLPPLKHKVEKPSSKPEPLKRTEANKSQEGEKPKKPVEKKIEPKAKVEAKVSAAKPRPDVKPTRVIERKIQKTTAATVEKKTSEKASPTTPKKTVAGVASKIDAARTARSTSRGRPSPTATPAKSAKDANNRKVVESKSNVSRVSTTASRPPTKASLPKKEDAAKPERKPIARKPRTSASPIKRGPGSPAKTATGKPAPKTEKESAVRKIKSDADKPAVDSSEVSTPSTAEAAEATLLKAMETVAKSSALLSGEPAAVAEVSGDVQAEPEEKAVEGDEKVEEGAEAAADDGEKEVEEEAVEDAAAVVESEVLETADDEKADDEADDRAVERQESAEVQDEDVTEGNEVEEDAPIEKGESLQAEMGLDDTPRGGPEEDEEIVECDNGEEPEEEEEYLIIEREEREGVDESLQDQESAGSRAQDAEEGEDDGELKKQRDEVESEKEKHKAGDEDVDDVNEVKDDVEEVIDDNQDDAADRAEESIDAKEIDLDEAIDAKEDGLQQNKHESELDTTDDIDKLETLETKDSKDETNGEIDLPNDKLITKENKEQIEEEVKEIILSAEETASKKLSIGEVKLEDDEKDEGSDKKKSEEGEEAKELSSISPEEKLDNSSEKNREATDDNREVTEDDRDTDQRIQDQEHDEYELKRAAARDVAASDQKYPAEESQPDEKFSATAESAATTAPTLPEDERIPLDEIKEIIEEKHTKEETKEKEAPAVDDAPRHDLPTTLPQVVVPGAVSTFPPHGLVHHRDIVKTPDEVADLPMHEEVDPGMYESNEFDRDFNKIKDQDSGTGSSKKQDSDELRRQSPELEITGELQLKDEEKLSQHDDVEEEVQVKGATDVESGAENQNAKDEEVKPDDAKEIVGSLETVESGVKGDVDEDDKQQAEDARLEEGAEHDVMDDGKEVAEEIKESAAKEETQIETKQDDALISKEDEKLNEVKDSHEALHAENETVGDDVEEAGEKVAVDAKDEDDQCTKDEAKHSEQPASIDQAFDKDDAVGVDVAKPDDIKQLTMSFIETEQLAVSHVDADEKARDSVSPVAEVVGAQEATAVDAGEPDAEDAHEKDGDEIKSTTLVEQSAGKQVQDDAKETKVDDVFEEVNQDDHKGDEKIDGADEQADNEKNEKICLDDVVDKEVEGEDGDLKDGKTLEVDGDSLQPSDKVAPTAISNEDLVADNIPLNELSGVDADAAEKDVVGKAAESSEVKEEVALVEQVSKPTASPEPIRESLSPVPTIEVEEKIEPSKVETISKSPSPEPTKDEHTRDDVKADAVPEISQTLGSDHKADSKPASPEPIRQSLSPEPTGDEHSPGLKPSSSPEPKITEDRTRSPSPEVRDGSISPALKVEEEKSRPTSPSLKPSTSSDKKLEVDEKSRSASPDARDGSISPAVDLKVSEDRTRSPSPDVKEEHASPALKPAASPDLKIEADDKSRSASPDVREGSISPAQKPSASPDTKLDAENKEDDREERDSKPSSPDLKQGSESSVPLPSTSPDLQENVADKDDSPAVEHISKPSSPDLKEDTNLTDTRASTEDLKVDTEEKECEFVVDAMSKSPTPGSLSPAPPRGEASPNLKASLSPEPSEAEQQKEDSKAASPSPSPNLKASLSPEPSEAEQQKEDSKAASPSPSPNLKASLSPEPSEAEQQKEDSKAASPSPSPNLKASLSPEPSDAEQQKEDSKAASPSPSPNLKASLSPEPVEAEQQKEDSKAASPSPSPNLKASLSPEPSEAEQQKEDSKAASPSPSPNLKASLSPEPSDAEQQKEDSKAASPSPSPNLKASLSPEPSEAEQQKEDSKAASPSPSPNLKASLSPEPSEAEQQKDDSKAASPSPSPNLKASLSPEPSEAEQQKEDSKAASPSPSPNLKASLSPEPSEAEQQKEDSKAASPSPSPNLKASLSPEPSEAEQQKEDSKAASPSPSPNLKASLSPEPSEAEQQKEDSKAASPSPSPNLKASLSPEPSEAEQQKEDSKAASPSPSPNLKASLSPEPVEAEQQKEDSKAASPSPSPNLKASLSPEPSEAEQQKEDSKAASPSPSPNLKASLSPEPSEAEQQKEDSKAASPCPSPDLNRDVASPAPDVLELDGASDEKRDFSKEEGIAKSVIPDHRETASPDLKTSEPDENKEDAKQHDISKSASPDHKPSTAGDEAEGLEKHDSPKKELAADIDENKVSEERGDAEDHENLEVADHPEVVASEDSASSLPRDQTKESLKESEMKKEVKEIDEGASSAEKADDTKEKDVEPTHKENKEVEEELKKEIDNDTAMHEQHKDDEGDDEKKDKEKEGPVEVIKSAVSSAVSAIGDFGKGLLDQVSAEGKAAVDEEKPCALVDELITEKSDAEENLDLISKSVKNVKEVVTNEASMLDDIVDASEEVVSSAAAKISGEAEKASDTVASDEEIDERTAAGFSAGNLPSFEGMKIHENLSGILSHTLDEKSLEEVKSYIDNVETHLDDAKSKLDDVKLHLDDEKSSLLKQPIMSDLTRKESSGAIAFQLDNGSFDDDEKAISSSESDDGSKPKLVEFLVGDEKIVITDAEKKQIADDAAKADQAVSVKAKIDELVAEDVTGVAKPDERPVTPAASITSTIATDDADTSHLKPAPGREQDISQSASDNDESVVGDDVTTVKRMLVTASSEDGGAETEVCPSGSITFTTSLSAKHSCEDLTSMLPDTEPLDLEDDVRSDKRGESTSSKRAADEEIDGKEKEVKGDAHADKVQKVEAVETSYQNGDSGEKHATNGHLSSSHEDLNGHESFETKSIKTSSETVQVSTDKKVTESQIKSEASKTFETSASDKSEVVKELQSVETVVSGSLAGKPAVCDLSKIPGEFSVDSSIDLLPSGVKKEIDQAKTSLAIGGDVEKLNDNVIVGEEKVHEVIIESRGMKEIVSFVDESADSGASISGVIAGIKKHDSFRSATPGSDDVDMGGPLSPMSDISSGQVSRVPDSRNYESDVDDDGPMTPSSVTSQHAHSPTQTHFQYELGDSHVSPPIDIRHTSATLQYDPKHAMEHEATHKEPTSKLDSAMTSSFYGELALDPLQQLLEEREEQEAGFVAGARAIKDPMTSSFYASRDVDDSAKYGGAFFHTESDEHSGEYEPESGEFDFERAMHEHRTARGVDMMASPGKTYRYETKSDTNGKASPSYLSKYDQHSVGDGGKHFAEAFGNGNVDERHFDDAMVMNKEYKEKLNGKSDSKETTTTTATTTTLTKEADFSATKTTSAIHDPLYRVDVDVDNSSASKTQKPEASKPDDKVDPIQGWGKPLGLPSPAPPPTENTSTNKGTPKKEKKPLLIKKSLDNKTGQKEILTKKRSDSPVKQADKKGLSNKDGVRAIKATGNPIYLDLTYVPHHGNSYYSNVEFFKKVRARYYVFSGTEPSREVYNALLEAKQAWDDKELEVTIIPTYDTDILGYWVAENEDILAKHKIDLSPSASRCTINLQDHETSCSAYRLEF